VAARKSVLVRVAVDEVLKAHNCQHNHRHRLERGQRRLKVQKERSPEHYCAQCALEIIERDIAKLQMVAQQLRGEADLVPEG
jgi:hypothetical protein